MKSFRITAVLAVTIISLLLTSCLRDDGIVSTSPVTDGESVSDTVQSEEMSTKADTLPESEDAEEELSESVLMWINRHDSPKDVIMTPDEIRVENARMFEASDRLRDLMGEVQVSAQELREDISMYGDVPGGRYDSDGSLISDEHRHSVRENMAQGSIPESLTVKLGIVTARANLRAFPDDKPYRKSPDNPYDSIQQTELHVASPVWVLHTSLDGEYHFVRAYNYSGWVKSDSIALTDDVSLWRYFAEPDSYVRITGVGVYLGNCEIDMGVRLPLADDRGDRYYVHVPARDTEGTLCCRELTVSARYAVVGDLPYTYENFIKQAFRYEGVMYSWGGLDTGVDCSGFIGNVMRTFGFMLPRDTRHQEYVVGISRDVRGKSHDELGAILQELGTPTAVYYPGHVLFYLGHNSHDGLYYFIHAPQMGEAVGVTSKSDLSGMTCISVFGAE